MAKQNLGISETKPVTDNDIKSLRKTRILTEASEEIAACWNVRSRSDHMLHKKGSVLNMFTLTLLVLTLSLLFLPTLPTVSPRNVKKRRYDANASAI